MLKIIDTDKLFDEYIKDYVYKNIGKVNPEEIENQMPVLYTEFGDTALKEFEGKTPNQYYVAYSAEELVNGLKEHVRLRVPVPDFLIEAIQKKADAAKAVYSSLLQDNEEEYTMYLMNIINDLGSDVASSRYMEFILSDYSETIKEFATECLSKNPDTVVASIIENFDGADAITKARFSEILAGAKKDDKIFEILINQFLSNPKEVPQYAGHLAKYGDERALPFLKTAIESDTINYADYEELRFAIEALGGEVTSERDFSKDSIYKKIKQNSKRFD